MGAFFVEEVMHPEAPLVPVGGTIGVRDTLRTRHFVAFGRPRPD
jgi:hypothetical protein